MEEILIQSTKDNTLQPSLFQYEKKQKTAVTR